MSQRGGTTCANSLKLEMNKFKAFVVKKKAFMRESTQPLIENKNVIQDGFKQAPCTKYENALVQNTLDIHKETCLQTQCRAAASLPVQRSVDQHFPKLPPDVDQNLHQYLENVQKMVITEFVRLGPPLTRMGLMGSLIDCYHRETFTRLDDLLQNVRSSKNSFGLMKWVLHTYLSSEMLYHPELQEVDPIKKVDLLLFTEWVGKAKDKLLENVENEMTCMWTLSSALMP
ncbi:Exocyst complex component 3 [Dissostichus eleginoides]|uniref:Exocyst complex component 3 n=1 Tax=Dissostichus eleginoides TaxID=100907 RepID=A0AAD9F9Q1_DISEL|nr:Exocyst complex component 3 [Dissostichus eleginoides]